MDSEPDIPCCMPRPARTHMSQKRRAAIRAANRRKAIDPKWLAAQRLAAKKRTKDEWRASIEKRSKNHSWRAAQKVAATMRVRDPKWRAAHRAAMKQTAQTSSWREAVSRGIRKRAVEDPGWQARRERFSAANIKKMLRDPKWWAAHAAGLRAMHADSRRHAAFISAMAAGRANKLSLSQEKLIIRLYEEGWSLSAISERLGLGHLGSSAEPRVGKVKFVLKKAGAYLTPRKRSAWRNRHGIPGRPKDSNRP